MDARLRPINAILGLLTPHGLYSDALRAAGFTLQGLEVPILAGGGRVVVDILLFHPATGLLVLIEAKSGANIEEEQARRYAAVTPQSAIQAAQVTVPRRVRPSVVVVYTCSEQHHDRIRLGLTAAGVDFPVLTFSPTEVALSAPSRIPDQLAAPFRQPIHLTGPSPRLLTFDHDSPVEVVIPIVRAQLVAALSHQRPLVSETWLTEQCAPHFPLYGRAARRNLIRLVSHAARRVAEEDPATFQFVPPHGNDGWGVRLLRTPEDLDRRGRTQAYQAVGRGSRTRRRGAAPPTDQLDLLSELDAGDDGDTGDVDGGEEETP